jgi:large subunit ribosomal protein L28
MSIVSAHNFTLALGRCIGYGSRLTNPSEGARAMSRRCEICGKGVVRGTRILRRGQAKKKGGIGQHVTAITPRLFKPNLQVVRALVNGTVRRVKACANCIKSGRVAKPA